MLGQMAFQFTTHTADGRTLDVHVDGPDGAVPLLFHNGTPSSGRLYAPFVEELAQRGLRMVGFSRAGYGGSARNPGRSVADVVSDVTAVLDDLGVQHFYTLGWSGGGPHALACAALLPERVIGGTTVGCLAPYDADGLDWMAGMGQENVDAFSAAADDPNALQQFLETVSPQFAAVSPNQVTERLGSLMSDVDRSALTGESAAWLAAVFRESVRDGIWGWYDDELALVKPWGFDPRQIDVPVAIWQGIQDRMTPFSHGEWLASYIPEARSHLLSDHGHLSLGVGSFGSLIDDLLGLTQA